MSAKLLELDAQRRDAILNSALREFTRRGYDSASTNTIAKDAGISKALMFHYVSSKQELFLAVYDFFSELIQKEYFELMDFGERDIFRRLRQSYFLQIKMSEKYPWILDLNKLSRPTKSAEVNEALKRRVHEGNTRCYPQLFDNIDETKFRRGLNVEKCKQLIYWANVGFADQLLERIRQQENPAPESAAVISELDEYLAELRNVFYGPGDSQD